MYKINKYLQIIVVVVLIYISGMAISKYMLYKQTTSLIHRSSSSPSCCSTCPRVPELVNSWNRFNPILGGVDIVSYFDLAPRTAFTNEQPLMGTSKYATTYLGYKYYFHNKTNLYRFKKNPAKFIPQCGGYCAKGIALEYCSSNKEFDELKALNPDIAGDFPWSANCLGPTASRDCWLIMHGKLLLFYSNEARDIFLRNPELNCHLAESRWRSFLAIWSHQEPLQSTSSFPSCRKLQNEFY
jgi:YHS domain-containing protein